MAKTNSGLKQDLNRAKYLVSFISLLSEKDEGYQRAAEQMVGAVQSQSGFIAAYSARNEDGVGITNSYWESIEAISKWKANPNHLKIQAKGKSQWYQWYQLQVSEIKKNYGG